jgi:hypothetical protein
MDILKAIDNDSLEQASDDVAEFRHVWLENGNEREKVERKRSEDENFSSTKRVKRVGHFSLRKLFVFFWFASIFVTFIVVYFKYVINLN